MRRTAQRKTESRLVQRVHTREGYWYYSDKTTMDNVSPPRVSFFTLMGRGNTVDVIPAVVDGGEVEIGGGAEQQKVSKCEGRPSENRI